MFHGYPRFVADRLESNFHVGYLAGSETLLTPREGQSHAWFPRFDSPDLKDSTRRGGFDQSSVRTGLVRLIRRPSARRFGVLQAVPTTYVTPRDFDLSPYFEIIKFNLIEDIKFDYRKIVWAEQEAGDDTLAKRAAPR